MGRIINYGPFRLENTSQQANERILKIWTLDPYYSGPLDNNLFLASSRQGFHHFHSKAT